MVSNQCGKCKRGYYVYTIVRVVVYKIYVMIKYDKMLYEVLINYIPKISNSLSEISEELKEMNIDDRLDNKLNNFFKNIDDE